MRTTTLLGSVRIWSCNFRHGNAIKERRGEEGEGEESRLEAKGREETYLLMFLNPGPYLGFRYK